MSNFTLVEGYQVNKTGTTAIRPYFDPSVSNMGLEKYNQSLFDNVFHEEEITCLEINGVKRFITGLNEFAPEVISLPKEQKEARILEIRKAVAQLEQELAHNVVDIEDKEFWNKLKLLKPDNYSFWSQIRIRVGNDPVYLDTKDPYDRIKLHALEAGGFSLVAKNLDACRTAERPLKFYLDKEEQTASIRTELKKIRNKALAELQKLFEKNLKKLMYVMKVVDFNSAQYRLSTPADVLYDNADKYINGETVDKDKRKTAERFLEIINLDMETLKLRAIVKDAMIYKIFATRPDGIMYHMNTGSPLGRNPSEVVEFLKNPANEDILKSTQNQVETYWI
jgi:hypothetical protein